MKEDELLRNLGQAAREQAASERLFLDERWDRLASGTLSVEEEGELRRLAETSEDARLAYEAFRPLGPEFQAKVVQAIEAQRIKDVVPLPVPWRPESNDPPLPAPWQRVHNDPPPPGRWRRQLAGWSAAAATMAATLVGIVPRVLPLLTPYVAELSGASITRGEVVEARELAPGERFQATLRPDTAVRGYWPLRSRVFLQREETIRRVDVDSEVGPTGAVRLTGTLDPDLSAGTWTLWLVVGRWGLMPDPAELRAAAAAPVVKERHWVAVSRTLRIHPRAP